MKKYLLIFAVLVLNLNIVHAKPKTTHAKALITLLKKIKSNKTTTNESEKFDLQPLYIQFLVPLNRRLVVAVPKPAVSPNRFLTPTKLPSFRRFR